MVCGYFIEIVALVLSAFINAPAIALAVPFGTTCDRNVYGVPDFEACEDLLYGGDGITQIDTSEHAFLLPYFGDRKQFTNWQWRHRVDLPEIWRNGKNHSFFFPTGRILFERKKKRTRIEIVVEKCSIALLVNINPQGGFLSDKGLWLDIASRGDYVARLCLLKDRIGGGVTYAGEKDTPHHPD